MQILNEKLIEVKCALMVLVVLVGVLGGAYVMTHLILGSLDLAWRYPVILIAIGCVIGLFLLIWLFPFIAGLAVVVASVFAIERAVPVQMAIMVAALIWWLPANMGISWSRPWASRWKHQNQMFLVRSWQIEISLLAHAVAYLCPIALLFTLLYMCYCWWR